MDNKEKIAIMQFYESGGLVQQKAKLNGNGWNDVKVPSWNFSKYDYRKKPNLFDEIDNLLNENNYYHINGTIRHTDDGFVSLNYPITSKITELIPSGYQIRVKLIIDKREKIDNIERRLNKKGLK